MSGDKQKDPLISIIVPVYKVELYLSRCVDSLIAQTYKNIEILLVDDGSPDNCPILCDEYAERDGRIRVIHKRNGGLSSARNAGIDAANGDYIAFVDSDDWVEPQTYSDMIELLINKKLDIVCCEISRLSNVGEIERYRFYDTGTVMTGSDVAKEILLDRIGSHVVKGLYKRNCWDEIRFPIGLLYEDIYVTYKVFDKAKAVGFISEPYYKYWENNAGISLSPNPIVPYHQFLSFKEHYDYALEHYPEIVDDCRANTAMYAISTCFHYYSEKHEALREPCIEAERFLKDNKKQIKAYKGFMKTRKLALSAFFFSKPIFKLACRIFNKSGLQKATHFDVK